MTEDGTLTAVQIAMLNYHDDVAGMLVKFGASDSRAACREQRERSQQAAEDDDDEEDVVRTGDFSGHGSAGGAAPAATTDVSRAQQARKARAKQHHRAEAANTATAGVKPSSAADAEEGEKNKPEQLQQQEGLPIWVKLFICFIFLSFTPMINMLFNKPIRK